MLDRAIGGKMLRKFLLRDDGNRGVAAKQNGARRGGSLIDGEDVRGQAIFQRFANGFSSDFLAARGPRTFLCRRNGQVLQPSLSSVNVMTTTGNILYDGDFLRTGLYTMNSGRGLVEVRFSGSNSFDLDAQTNIGTVDNQAAAFLKPDTHSNRHNSNQKFAHSLFGTVGQGLAKVELSSYSGTIRILKRN